MAATAVAPRRRIIPRPRLTRLLDENPARIKLLVAPAGYGKTTLAQQWLETSSRRSARYRGGHASSDVAELAVGLSKAAGVLIPGAGARMRERIRAVGDPQTDVDLLAELLAEDLGDWPPDGWLLFDDYQLAMDSHSSERFVETLSQGAEVQLLITSRRRPTWATARRSLYGEFQEIGLDDLAMDETEAAAVLGRDDSQTRRLVEKACGWAAVIGLAAAADPASLPEDESLPESLYAYLAEELFQTLAPEVQRVLPVLALVSEFSRDLVTSLVDRRAAGKVLEEAVRAGAAVSERGTLRFHPLFRQFLDERLQSLGSEGSSLANTITSELIHAREWDEAFSVLRTYPDQELLQKLVGAGLRDYLEQGRLTTVARWVALAAQLDSDEEDDGVFALAEAELAFRHGEYGRAEALAYEGAEVAEDTTHRAKLLLRAGQSALMDSREHVALIHFRRASTAATTPETKREAIIGTLFASFEVGVPHAGELLKSLEGIDLRGAEARTRAVVARLVLAARVGGLETALASADRAYHTIAKVPDPSIRAGFLTSYALVSNMAARYERAVEITKAELAEAERYRLSFVVPHALVVQAHGRIGTKDYAGAVSCLEVAERLGASFNDIHVQAQAAALRARMALAHHRFEEAAAFATKQWDRPVSRLMRAELLAFEAFALACLAEGDSTRAADAADRIGMYALEAQGITAFARAIAQLKAGGPQGREDVRAALELVSRTGYVDGLVLAYRSHPPLLRAAVDVVPENELLAKALMLARDSALGRRAGLDVPGPQSPVRPLTRRETQVLDLVREGLTNREISETLFLSEATVKVHVRHILEKLGARTRTEAAARAPDL